jgi:hypothetical protein
MATDQEMTIIDVIHVALDRVPVSMAITILSGIYAEICTENDVPKATATAMVGERFDEYFELVKTDRK